MLFICDFCDIISTAGSFSEGGEYITTNEEEYNGYLFDQLSLIEEVTEVAKAENAANTLKILEVKKSR